MIAVYGFCGCRERKGFSGECLKGSDNRCTVFELCFQNLRVQCVAVSAEPRSKWSHGWWMSQPWHALTCWWTRLGFCFVLFSQSPGLHLLICNPGIVRALSLGHHQDWINWSLWHSWNSVWHTASSQEVQWLRLLLVSSHCIWSEPGSSAGLWPWLPWEMWGSLWPSHSFEGLWAHVLGCWRLEMSFCVFSGLTLPLDSCIITCSLVCVPTAFQLHGGIFPLYFMVCASCSGPSPWGVRDVWLVIFTSQCQKNA